MFTEVQIYVSVQYPAVVKRYRERVQRVPADSAARVELGKALTKCGRYVEAARELRLAAQDPVVRAQALHECAVANYRAGNFQQAVADGSAAKAANPENGRMRSFLWLSAQRMGGYPPEVPPEHRMEMKVGYEKPTVEFEDIDSKIGLDKTSAGRGVAVFDYNNDGHLDVVIAADFIDYPLNNRWWLEDEFKKVRGLPSEAAKVKRLRVIARWEHPGPGSFYDNVGNASKAPHVLPGETEPTFWWWDEGKSRARLSWQATMWPRGVVYEGLDPEASYIVRTSGYGQAPLRINGDRVEPVLDGKEMGEFKEFIVPRESLKDRRLVLTWDRPDERALNWRKRSRLSEVWLLKKE